MYGGDEVSALVLDIGSVATKSGYAGEDTPKFVIPSSVGVMGGEEAAASEGSTDAAKKAFLVGTNALSVQRDGMRMESAFTDGVISNWDAAEALMEHSYKNCLSSDPSEHPLLLAEPSFNPAPAREKMTELAFEKFQVPALFLSKNAVLSAFAAGRGTALVLDVGGGTTTATAVHDGYVLTKPLIRSPVAGELLSELLLKSLQSRDPAPPIHPLYTLKRHAVGPGEESVQVQEFPGTHPSYHRYMQLQVIKDVKESVCRCAFAPPTEGAPLEISSWESELPDRSVVDFAWERLHLPELLFSPSLLGQPRRPGSRRRAALRSRRRSSPGSSPRCPTTPRGCRRWCRNASARAILTCGASCGGAWSSAAVARSCPA